MKQNNSTEPLGYYFNNTYNKNDLPDPLDPKSAIFPRFSWRCLLADASPSCLFPGASCQTLSPSCFPPNATAHMPNPKTNARFQLPHQICFVRYAVLVSFGGSFVIEHRFPDGQAKNQPENLISAHSAE